MAYSPWVDTSLHLNLKPLRHVNDIRPIKKVESKSLHFERKISVKDESGALEEELKRVNEENKRLTEKLTVMCEKYNALRKHLMDYMNKNPDQKELVVSSTKKRKSESSNNDSISNHVVGIISSNGNSENSSTDHEDTCKILQREESIKSKITTAYVRIEPSDTTLVVKDGYQWRKYGQKVTRDNPCPRAYFKCSFAPSCPVKKKVQKSVEDQCVLVATYEGEHNHPPPSQLDHQANSSSTRSSTVTLSGSINPFSISTNGGSSAPSNIILDLINSKSKSNPRSYHTSEVQKFLVEQMASSLTKDPQFTAALAAAISR